MPLWLRCEIERHIQSIAQTSAQTTSANQYWASTNPNPNHSTSSNTSSSSSPSIVKGDIQYFETFCIDKIGVRDATSVLQGKSVAPDLAFLYASPPYQAINAVPLPVQKTSKGLMKALNMCFNCGSSSHAARECQERRDEVLVRMNSKLFSEHKPARHNTFQGRYFLLESQAEVDDRRRSLYQDQRPKTASLPPSYQFDSRPPGLSSNNPNHIHIPFIHIPFIHIPFIHIPFIHIPFIHISYTLDC
eukprot:TRINITY_DN14278_c0_g1_i4.p1 TRINITY_DN14278_c0_g1~~TRINITY_DN14278_c0_g1_i4.p1  ORF type:complete len:246 (-),score=8.84 TRINITY_DN14278_c0_g1_i4:42-779(-)